MGVMEIKHPLYTDDGEWLPGHNESEGGGPEIRRGFYDQINGRWRRAEEGGADDHICPRGAGKRSSVSPSRLDVLSAWGDGKSGYEKRMYVKTRTRRVGWEGELH